MESGKHDIDISTLKNMMLNVLAGSKHDEVEWGLVIGAISVDYGSIMAVG